MPVPFFPASGGTWKSFAIGVGIGLAAGVIANAIGGYLAGGDFYWKVCVSDTWRGAFTAGALTGAIAGGISSAVYGTNVGRGMLEGMAGGAIGAAVGMATTKILESNFMKPTMQILKQIGSKIFETVNLTIGTLKNLTKYTYETITDVMKFIGKETMKNIPTSLNITGKIWGSPNFAVGFAYGFIGVLLGGDWPAVHTDGTIHFPNNPLIMDGTALSLGVGLYGKQIPGYEAPYPTFAGHETLHFPQNDVLGPLYLPVQIIDKIINGLTGGERGFNGGLLEKGPYNGKTWW